jgi:hypothetical protein
LPYLLALKAESLHRANRTPEALNMIREAIARPVAYSIRWWLAELLRLPGVFLVAIGADESGIGLIVLHSHRNGKTDSVSLLKRTEMTY